jgi:hypothetical protein
MGKFWRICKKCLSELTHCLTLSHFPSSVSVRLESQLEHVYNAIGTQSHTWTRLLPYFCRSSTVNDWLTFCFLDFVWCWSWFLDMRAWSSGSNLSRKPSKYLCSNSSAHVSLLSGSMTRQPWKNKRLLWRQIQTILRIFPRETHSPQKQQQQQQQQYIFPWLT